MNKKKPPKLKWKYDEADDFLYVKTKNHNYEIKGNATKLWLRIYNDFEEICVEESKELSKLKKLAQKYYELNKEN